MSAWYEMRAVGHELRRLFPDGELQLRGLDANQPFIQAADCALLKLNATTVPRVLLELTLMAPPNF